MITNMPRTGKWRSRAAKPHRIYPRATVAAAVVAAALSIGGCGDRAPTKPGQVVARVNGVEITVHQLNSELVRLGVRGGADNEAATRRVLEALVDQQLLAERAAKAKLDRDPQVMLALEQARQRMLGEAWLERSVDAEKPRPEELKKFYADNPALFANRRLYSFHEFLIARPQFTDALRAALDSAKTPADVTAALKARNIEYRESPSTRGAEQLPLESLPRIAAMAKGDIFVMFSGESAALLQLVSFAEQPVTPEQAAPHIERYLINNRRRELAQTRIKELRAGAKIEYVGAYAEKGAAEKPQATGPSPAEKQAENEESLRKGLQGLTGR